MDRLEDRVKARKRCRVLRGDVKSAKRRKFLKSVLFSAAGLTSLRLANSGTALAASGSPDGLSRPGHSLVFIWALLLTTWLLTGTLRQLLGIARRRTFKG